MAHELAAFPSCNSTSFLRAPSRAILWQCFPTARGLSDQLMQALAREMNLSETTFVLPRDPAIERERGVRVRIFTVQEELPFAGHPTLGTAFCPARFDRRRRSGSRTERGPGSSPLRGKAGTARLRRDDPGRTQFGLIHDRETVVRATSLRDGDIDPSLPIQTVSTGLPFTIVPLRGLDVIRRLQVDLASSSEYLQQSGGGKFFYFVTRETVDPAARLHARMLFYGGEDPATGSAAGCATAWMVAHGVAQPDEHVLIEQGIEMLRPSRIFVRASRRDNRVVNVRVGGNAVEVLRGEVSF